MEEEKLDISSKPHSDVVNDKQIVRLTVNNYIEKIRFEGNTDSPVGILHPKERGVSFFFWSSLYFYDFICRVEWGKTPRWGKTPTRFYS